MKVLLHIDDDKHFRDAFALSMKRAGQTVVSCRDDKEAQKLSKGRHIDAAATDGVSSAFARQLAMTVPVIQLSGSPNRIDKNTLGFAPQAVIDKLDDEWPELVLECVSDHRLREYRIDTLYRQIAELDATTDKNCCQTQRQDLVDELRILQEQEAAWIEKAYDASRILPSNAGRSAILEADKILEQYEQSASSNEPT
jgi:hypothetical protein